MSFHYFLRAPKFPLPLLTPTTQARKKCDRAKFFLLIRPTEFFGCFRCLRRFTAVKRVKFAKYFKVKVATFTVESLGYYQHPVSLLNFLKVY